MFSDFFNLFFKARVIDSTRRALKSSLPSGTSPYNIEALADEIVEYTHRRGPHLFKKQLRKRPHYMVVALMSLAGSLEHYEDDLMTYYLVALSADRLFRYACTVRAFHDSSSINSFYMFKITELLNAHKKVFDEIAEESNSDLNNPFIFVEEFMGNELQDRDKSA